MDTFLRALQENNEPVPCFPPHFAPDFFRGFSLVIFDSERSGTVFAYSGVLGTVQFL